jgi:hypothetical protein
MARAEFLKNENRRFSFNRETNERGSFGLYSFFFNFENPNGYLKFKEKRINQERSAASAVRDWRRMSFIYD